MESVVAQIVVLLIFCCLTHIKTRILSLQLWMCHAVQAKLADFGLHKRVRKMVSSGALVPWSQETTYRGLEYEPSYYGGNLYLRRSAISNTNSTVDENSMHGSSLNGSLHRSSAAAAALEAEKAAAPPLQPAPGAPATVPAATGGGHQRASAGASSMTHGSGSFKSMNGSSLHSKTAAVDSSSASSAFMAQPLSTAFATGAGKTAMPQGADSCHVNSAGAFTPSDSAASFHHTTRAPSSPFSGAARLADGDDSAAAPALFTAQQQGLLDVVQAKSLGLLGKQEFVTHVLSAASAGPGLLKVSHHGEAPACLADTSVAGGQHLV
jgi:hypothetical protein